MFIDELFILTEAGQVLLRHLPSLETQIEANEEEGERDLIAGFLSAMQSFSKSQFNANLTDYTIGNKHFDIYSNNSFNFFIVAKTNKLLPTILHKHKQRFMRAIAIRFHKEFQKELDKFSGEVGKFILFSKTIQEILNIFNPKIVYFLLSNEFLMNKPPEAPSGSLDLIEWYTSDLSDKLKQLSIEFAVYHPFQGEDGLFITVVVWNSQENDLNTIEDKNEIGNWVIDNDLSYINFIKQTQKDFLTSEWIYNHFLHIPDKILNNPNPDQIGMIMIPDSVIMEKKTSGNNLDSEISRCTVCNIWSKANDSVKCQSCGSDLCEQENCHQICENCGIKLCPTCINSCSSCEKTILCWNCIIWDEHSKIDLCIDCWEKESHIYEERDIYLEIWHLKKLGDMHYRKGNFERSLDRFQEILEYGQNLQESTVFNDTTHLNLKLKMANCLIISKDFQNALKIYKELEDHPMVCNNYILFESVSKGLIACYSHMVKNLNNTSPPMVIFYQKLIDKYYSKLANKKEDLAKGSLHELNRFEPALSNPEYFQYSPPKGYKFIFRMDINHKMQTITFSPFDKISKVKRELVFQFKLPPYAHYQLFLHEIPLKENLRLNDYNINIDDDVLILDRTPKLK
jgi:tetratricopeptide (TPR) repeat protein